MESFLGYCNALIDMHSGELHIVAGHTSCGMECGHDVLDKEISYRHLGTSMTRLQKMFNEGREQREVVANVVVAGMLIHVDDTKIVAVETFTVHEMASFIAGMEKVGFDITRHMVGVRLAQQTPLIQQMPPTRQSAQAK